ncbi:MAG: flagellar basal body rod protein FlgB [Campylobacteraceae bacterium]|nr:flagellar basal body rod protein FlgB [Campylobacteraceae bacterium]
MQASNVSSLLFQHLSHTAERQKVITGNIANINTPNFKTKELVFENELKMVQTKNDLRLDVTHHNHIRLQAEISNKSKSRVVEVQNLQEQNDGNNVSLDQQISEMSKNRTQFHAIQSAIKKDSRWFKSVIESSSKN